MKKNILKIGILSILSLILVYFVVFVIQNYYLSKSIEYRWLSSKSTKLLSYDTVRCNWNIFKPEIAFVDESVVLDKFREMEIFFYKPKKLFSQTQQEWEDSYVGGTDIKNTTFPQLLAMVKDDCYQFQKDYDNPKVNEGGIDWGYRENKEIEEYKPPKRTKDTYILNDDGSIRAPQKNDKLPVIDL